ncbi:MAG: ABC transporter ATP-binding protein [Clostridia bacterium]|nr:ABC transporter ATP-binding protein [Clostridia bacterium]
MRDIPRYLRELFGGFFGRMLYVFRLVWQAAPWILFVKMFMALFNGIMPLIGSYLSKDVINGLQLALETHLGGTAPDFRPIMFSLVWFFTYRIANQIVTRVSTAITTISGEMVVNHIKVMIMEKAKQLDLASFDMPAFYERLENANREAGNRPIQVLTATFDIISNLVSVISYIIVLGAVTPLAPIAMILVAIPSAIVNFIYRRKHYSYMRFRSKERRQMNYFSGLLVNKDVVKEIRLLDLSDNLIGRYKTVFRQYFSGLRRLILSEHAWHVLTSVLHAVVNCVFFLLIAYRVFEGTLMIGDYTFYTGALTSISSGVASLISISATIYEGTLFIDNLIAFMKEEQTVLPRLPEPARIAHGIPHTIEFRNVSFRYPGTERDVIRNLNLTIEAGETVVIVGLNGAGKTTLIKLLTRLYDPTEGEIYLDGRDLRDYDVKDLYSVFGIIFQDYGHYAVTVAENITFGNLRREADDAAVRAAAEQAGAAEYIEALPDQYNTPLMRIFERNGTELSGGQWQKLAIARAFYADSDILILDEPTAALDPMAEQEIFNQFDTLRQGKTTIFVSHRLSSATSASKVVVLEHGRIIEEGNHYALMQQQGRYYALFTTQARRYVEGSEDRPAAEQDQGSRHPDRPPHRPDAVRAGRRREYADFDE